MSHVGQPPRARRDRGCLDRLYRRDRPAAAHLPPSRWMAGAYDIARKAVDTADSLRAGITTGGGRQAGIARRRCGQRHLFLACGGTYIRSLARDLAVALGTVGHVSRLRRLSVGPFDATRFHWLFWKSWSIVRPLLSI